MKLMKLLLVWGREKKKKQKQKTSKSSREDSVQAREEMDARGNAEGPCGLACLLIIEAQ
jgi:hypothetical protein